MTGQMIINTSDFHFATEDLHATSNNTDNSIGLSDESGVFIGQ